MLALCITSKNVLMINFHTTKIFQEGFILLEELAREKFIGVMLVISQSKKCARSRRATRHNGSRHKNDNANDVSTISH